MKWGRHLLNGGENRRYFGFESQPLIRGQMRYQIGNGHIGVTMKAKLYHLLELRNEKRSPWERRELYQIMTDGRRKI
ncbi:hypothetical protein MtrunA17_Chr6g0460021 [Medicago truncatula]|uniref:Uncharacterized protein n=1 Tax=Medicago truncatula TaxID=3880 RepID=I3RZQ5_MEDTR|nr:unknown [Medicago truncatula]RHN50668.1 hypothetical protein MtrunA17_Chr6g0460021 [Medicago truncatula]